MPDILGMLFRPPVMPLMKLAWWARMDGEARMMVKDAFELSFWAGITQALPYMVCALVIGYLVGRHLGERSLVIRLLAERKP